MTPNKDNNVPPDNIKDKVLTAGIDHEFTIYYNAEPANYEYKEVILTITLSKAVVYLNGNVTIITNSDNSSTTESQSNRTYTRDYNSSGYTIIPSVSCDTIAEPGTMVVDNLIGADFTYSGVGVTDGNTFKDGGTYTVTVSVNDPNFTFFVEDDTHPMDDSKPNTFTVKINSAIWYYTYKDSKWAINSATTSGLMNIDDIVASPIPSGHYSTSNVTIIVAYNTRLNSSIIIPSDVTLLVPYNEDYDKDTMPMVDADKGSIAPYSTLTVSEGTEEQSIDILIYGTLNVSAQQRGMENETNGNHISHITGTYGNMILNRYSKVVVSGKLYSFGFISGNGEILITEGAEVYEPLDIDDWPGGSRAMNLNNAKIFPFSQFNIANIKTKMTVNTGGKYYGHYYFEITGVTAKGNLKLFGNDDDSTLFQIKSGSVTKQVDTNGKTLIRADEKSVIITNNISVTVKAIGLVPTTISTKTSQIPICGFYNIIVSREANITLNSKFRLLPGASFIIEEGATCTIASGAGLYANKQGEYVHFDSRTVYGYTCNGRFGENSDIEMRVDGEIEVQSGGYLCASITSGSDTAIIDLKTGSYVSQTIDPHSYTGDSTTEAYTYQLSLNGISTPSADNKYYGRADGTWSITQQS